MSSTLLSPVIESVCIEPSSSVTLTSLEPLTPELLSPSSDTVSPFLVAVSACDTQQHNDKYLTSQGEQGECVNLLQRQMYSRVAPLETRYILDFMPVRLKKQRDGPVTLDTWSLKENVAHLLNPDEEDPRKQRFALKLISWVIFEGMDRVPTGCTIQDIDYQKYSGKQFIDATEFRSFATGDSEIRSLRWPLKKNIAYRVEMTDSDPCKLKFALKFVSNFICQGMDAMPSDCIIKHFDHKKSGHKVYVTYSSCFRTN